MECEVIKTDQVQLDLSSMDDAELNSLLRDVMAEIATRDSDKQRDPAVKTIPKPQTWEQMRKALGFS